MAKGLPKTEDGVPWEVHDAFHTLRRAHHIVKNKKLMAHVKKHATKMADETRMIGHQAGMLAKMGRISPKQMAKIKTV